MKLSDNYLKMRFPCLPGATVEVARRYGEICELEGKLEAMQSACEILEGLKTKSILGTAIVVFEQELAEIKQTEGL